MMELRPGPDGKVVMDLETYKAWSSGALIPESARQMPETRPDSDAGEHRALCECDVCKRPGAMRIKRLAHRRQVRRR